MTPDRLEVRALTVQTRREGEVSTLVDGLNFALRRGEILALVGPSGSGKSLTCAASLDVLPPGTWRETGSISIDGVPCSPSALRGRKIATILQNPRSAFNPVRTMGDHARETMRAVSTDPSRWKEIASTAMEASGLDEVERVLGLHPFEMSGGMLQRMMIALAIMSEAPFLFADEPTTDLDLTVQREILDLIEQLRETRGLGILLVTHDMGVVARLADRVAVMDNGRIIETGPVMEMFHRPSHRISRGLINAHLSLYGMELAS